MSGQDRPFAPSDLYEMPGHLIRRLQQIAVSIWLGEMSGRDIRPVQFAALTAIRAYPGIDQVALARALAFDRSTIQDVVLRIVRKGWVRRGADPEDLRRRVLFVTEAGTAVLDAMVADNRRAQERILAPLGEEERAVFMEMLTRLVHVNNLQSRAPLVIRPSEEGPRDAGEAWPGA